MRLPDLVELGYEEFELLLDLAARSDFSADERDRLIRIFRTAILKKKAQIRIASALGVEP